MASSGVTTFNLDVVELIEEAYERVGTEARTGYDMRTARRSLNLLVNEWANRGVNLWTVEEVTTSVAAAVASVNLSTSTIDVLDVSWRTGTGVSQTDRKLTRSNSRQWASIVNKSTEAEPTQFWLSRTTTPVLHLWPIPDAEGTLVYYRMRRIEDAAAFGNTMDMPSRFLPALTAGLAYYLAMKVPSAAQRLPMLQAEYERQYSMAAEEDRDRSSMFLRPGGRR